MVPHDPRIPALQDALAGLTQALVDGELWQDEVPSDEALASTAPFCCDTLSLAQWLQFVLLPRLTWMMAEGLALPAQSGILVMAEQSYGEDARYQALLAALARLDQAFNGEVTA